MRMVDIILKKKEGKELTGAEICFVVNGYSRGEIPDYQMSAFLMAVCFQGMSKPEVAALTDAMLNSGDVIDLSDIPGVKVDKHSTGGVGDTTTLILAPLVAACGVPVAKISGRGLGHTGGTLDKLESVPGVSVAMTTSEFIDAVKTNGIAVMGQTQNLVPADKKMYALRDVTGTVGSIPLIASSIMSKKLASGSNAIVLDVKCGNGAFMENLDEAKLLSSEMVELGKSMGRRVVAFVTDMNQPLGSAVGNALELREAIIALKGGLDYEEPLMQVTFALGEQMLILAGAAENETQARSMLVAALESGKGLKKLKQLILELGGSGECCDDENLLLKAKSIVDVRADKAGFVSGVDTVSVGEAAMLLGAGRSKKEDVIDPDVGLIMNVRLRDRVEIGDVLAKLFVNDEKNLNASAEMLKAAISIEKLPPSESAQLIYAVVR